MEIDTEAFAAARRCRLRRYREAAGLTLEEVAGELGVSVSTVHRWERENDVAGDYWPVLARLYGVHEPYPNAPFNPERRRAWFDWRNESMVAVPPPSGTFGRAGAAPRRGDTP